MASANVTATPSAESIERALASVPEGYAIVPLGADFFSARVLVRDVETSAIIGYRELSLNGLTAAIERDPAKLLPLITQHQQTPQPSSASDENTDASETSRRRHVPVFGTRVERPRSSTRMRKRA